MSLLSRKNSSKKKTNRPKDPDDYLLALDIGTEYVKALIAKKAKNGIHIVGVGKAHEAPTNIFSGAIADIPGVVKTCEEALYKAEKMAGVRANEVVVGIAGELIKGNTASIKYRRTSATKPITEEEMGHIIKKVQQKGNTMGRKPDIFVPNDI